jgi:hypothetical protein
MVHVSLENALSFREATIELTLATGYTADTRPFVAEVRVVAAPR